MTFEKWDKNKLSKVRASTLFDMFAALANWDEWKVKVLLIHLNILYFEDKRFCRLDSGYIDKPYTHPEIAANLFIEDIKERNRLQANREKVLQTNDFKWARTIHPIIAFSVEEILKDLDRRINQIEQRIEHFHANYIL